MGNAVLFTDSVGRVFLDRDPERPGVQALQTAIGPPGTFGQKWIPANGAPTAVAGKDSIAARSVATPQQTAGPKPDGPPPNR